MTILIDEPKPVSLERYDECISEMVEMLSKIPGVLSVYQIGGVSSPGISDIDMVVIFKDGASCLYDPRLSQSNLSRSLFTHHLFATSESIFKQSQVHTFFHNFKLLHGNKQEILDGDGSKIILKRQWAKEFLVRMLINMSVEREYRIYKVRNLLLNGKALFYDIEFLEIDDSLFCKSVDQIIAWRGDWFNNRPHNDQILKNIEQLWASLITYIDQHFNEEVFYLPERSKYHLGGNVVLRNNSTVSATSCGPKLPWAPKPFARKIISIQNRLNQFTIEVPFTTENIPDEIHASFAYREIAEEYNRQFLPHFMPLTSSLVFRP